MYNVQISTWYFSFLNFLDFLLKYFENYKLHYKQISLFLNIILLTSDKPLYVLRWLLGFPMKCKYDANKKLLNNYIFCSQVWFTWNHFHISPGQCNRLILMIFTRKVSFKDLVVFFTNSHYRVTCLKVCYSRTYMCSNLL